MIKKMSVQQRWAVGGIYCTMLVLACVDTYSHLLFIRQPFSWVLRPMLRAERFFETSVRFPVHFLANVMRSEQMIADLQSKNIQLQVQIAQAEFTKQENLRLLQELEKTTKLPNTDVFKVSVISHLVHVDAISVLDKGTDDLVKPGGLVFIQGVLFGKIKEVDQFFSRAIFFNQGSWSTVAQTQSGVKGVIVGKKNQVLFTQVAAGEHIEAGDQLFTVGSYVDSVPPGLFLGQIGQVQEHIGAPVQTAVVSQLVDIQATKLVTIKMRE